MQIKRKMVDVDLSDEGRRQMISNGSTHKMRMFLNFALSALQFLNIAKKNMMV